VDCSLQVGTECLPQAKELKYLGGLFTSEGKMEREIDRRIGAAAAVKQALYRSVLAKRSSAERQSSQCTGRSTFQPSPMVTNFG